MLEFRCGEVGCFYHFLLKEWDDPTTSSGCCKLCGGAKWTLRETSMTEQEYFKQTLKDPNGTISYHVGEIIG